MTYCIGGCGGNGGNGGIGENSLLLRRWNWNMSGFTNITNIAPESCKDHRSWLVIVIGPEVFIVITVSIAISLTEFIVVCFLTKSATFSLFEKMCLAHGLASGLSPFSTTDHLTIPNYPISLISFSTINLWRWFVFHVDSGLRSLNCTGR